MDSIDNLLQKRRQQINRQQAQVDDLNRYLQAHYPDEIAVASRPDQLSLSTSDPALASQLQLDWVNLVKYCRQPEQKLVVKVVPPESKSQPNSAPT